jgi:integrase/recombinase XerD
MNKELRVALEDLKRNLELAGWVSDKDPSTGTLIKAGMPVITTERNRMTGTSAQAVVNMFQGWFQVLGFSGCSSHSGRRTFITNAARKISTVGGSLRDVQMLAGHSNLSTTQRYIEADSEAQQRIVQMV